MSLTSPKYQTKEIEQKIDYALQIAFMAGRWLGQVDLEESMENDSYFDAMLTFIHSQKTGGQCMHTVGSSDINSRPIRYNLRSEKWRKGVKKEVEEWKKEAKDHLKDLYVQ
jgi:hypothetical protein